MNNQTANVKKSRNTRALVRVGFPSALLIFAASLEVLMMVKDIEFYESWQNVHADADFSIFLNVHIFLYLRKILYPTMLTLYTFATVDKLGITRTYELVWGGLGGAAFLMHVLEFKFDSIFYYLNIAIYLVIVYFVFTLRRFAETTELEK